MMRGHWIFASIACTASLVAPVRGQSRTSRAVMPSLPRALPPQFLQFDSLSLNLRSRTLWRGMGLGKEGLAVALDGTLWLIDGVQDRHALVARLAGAFPFSAWNTTPRTDLLEATLGYRYRLDTEEGELDVRYTRRRLDAADAGRSMNEVSASVQRRVTMPGSETRPVLALDVARELGRGDAMVVQPRLSLQLGLPVQNNGARSVGARLDVGAGFGNYATRRSPHPSFGFREVKAGVWLVSDRAESFAGPMVLELGVIPWWSRATTGPRGMTFALAVVLR